MVENKDNKTDTKSDTKSKFNFSCTKCGKCCLERGPIPLIMDDMIMWAKNNVVMNFMPYLKFIRTPHKTLDFVLAREDKNPFEEETKGDKKETDLSCPFLNKEKKECTIYQYRPYSCRTYPLEYDGKNYAIVDDACPGVDKGEMSVEARTEMRDMAKKMNIEITKMRIMMPIIGQAMQTFVVKELFEQQKKMMEQMTPEERAKMDEEIQKASKGSK